LTFEHAIAINMITSNPATDVRNFRIQTDGFRVWTALYEGEGPKALAERAAGKLKQARAVGTEGEQELSNIPTMLDKTGKIA
jgi:hypothetical protein